MLAYTSQNFPGALEQWRHRMNKNRYIDRDGFGGKPGFLIFWNDRNIAIGRLSNLFKARPALWGLCNCNLWRYRYYSKRPADALLFREQRQRQRQRLCCAASERRDRNRNDVCLLIVQGQPQCERSVSKGRVLCGGPTDWNLAHGPVWRCQSTLRQLWTIRTIHCIDGKFFLFFFSKCVKKLKKPGGDIHIYSLFLLTTRTLTI